MTTRRKCSRMHRPTGRSAAIHAECGMATVLMASVLGGLLILVGAIAVVVDVAHTKSRASTAADMAALAGANEVLFGEPCQRAQAVAHANSAELQSCTIEGEDVQVAVETSMQGALRAVFRSVRSADPKVTGVSRAGPPRCDSKLLAIGILC